MDGAIARLDVLFVGYVGERVAGTVSLVRSGNVTAVVDPGMVPARSAILDPLAALGIDPAEVTDVILSHHHPDHTVNIALFENARVQDHWAIYDKDRWDPRQAEGFEVAPGVELMETPGHTPQDITTLVTTEDGVAALTHLWWHERANTDPLAFDLDALHHNRAKVIEVASLIVPGHGVSFVVDAQTPP